MSSPLINPGAPEERFMREAIRLAIEGLNAGRGGPFGAVVVKDGQIIGRGCNCVTSTNDPTAHAEVLAIRDACSRLSTFHLDGCQLYTSCEPCPMCLAAIYWARLKRLYYSATAADAAAAGFDDAFIAREFALPPTKRSIATQRLLENEAATPFLAWQDKPDKVPY